MSYLVQTTDNDTKKKVKAIKTTCSAVANVSHSAFEDVLGGTIEYTPADNSTYVYYEYNSMINYKDPGKSAIQFRILYGPDSSNLTSINTNDVNYKIYMGTDSQDFSSWKQEEIVPLKIAFLIPVWTGSKLLVLQAKEDSTSEEYYLHGIKADSNEESSDDLFDPFVIVYSF